VRRFDAVLLDVGGVLVLPDPTVIGPLLAYYGGDPAIDRHRRAHYVGMHAKSAAAAGESDWAVYDDAYVDAVGVGPDDRDEAARVLGRSRGPDWWRWPIPESVHALGLLARSGTAVGIVSNASGQVEAMLRRGVAQVGPGRGADVRVIVDSHVVGVA
jgi:putative hydrolase of the HAD superfamily